MLKKKPLAVLFAISIALLMTLPSFAAWQVTKNNYPISGDRGEAWLWNYNGVSSWFGTIYSQIRRGAGPGTPISTIGRNYWNLSTVCGSVAIVFQPYTGEVQTPSPSNSYIRNSVALSKGTCGGTQAWYGYQTAKHDFNSISAGAWNPITDAVVTFR